MQVLNIFCGWTLATGILAFVTHKFIVIFIPASISFITCMIYFVDSYDCSKKMNAEKKRIEAYEQFHKTINKV